MLTLSVRITKVYRRSSGMAPLILNLGTRWRRALSPMTWLPYLQWKRPLVSV